MNKIKGFSLIEILIGVAIASIMMAAMFASYTVVNNTYSRVSDVAGISRSGRDIVSMLMRDIRMAGFKYYYGVFEDSKSDIPKEDYLKFVFGRTSETKDDSHMPIVIDKDTLGYSKMSTDIKVPGAAYSIKTDGDKHIETDDKLQLCCDRIHIVYGDFDANDPDKQYYKRYKVTYFAIPFKRKISENISDNYYAIYKSKQSWKQAIDENEGSWDANCNECYKAELIREYVTDMEFVALDKDGKTVNADPTENLEEMFNIRSVDVKITFRSSSKKGYFQKKQQKLVNSFTADRSIQSDDNYLRENIFVTVHTRNIGGAL